MTVPLVWAAGRVRTGDESRPGFAERAFRYGDGVFATLRLRNGSLLDANAHLKRLARAASAVGLIVPETVGTTGAVLHLLSRLGAGPQSDGVVRIQVSAGPGSRGYSRHTSDPLAEDPWELVELLPPPEDRRLTVTLLEDGSVPVPALPALKTCSAIAHVLCAREAKERGFEEAVRVTGGAVLEAGAANVFWTSGKTLFTPSSSLPLYPGVTRSVVLSVAEDLRWTVSEGRYPPSAIAAAETAFLTNATRGIEPVVALEDKVLAWPRALRELQSAVERVRERAAPRLPGGVSEVEPGTGEPS